MPAGRDEALPLELEPEPVPDPEAPDDGLEPEVPEVEPTVVLAFPEEEEPVVPVWVLSRAILLLTSQH